MNMETFLNMEHDPWSAAAVDPHDPAHHDAFIGNGHLGIRVPVEGETSPYPEFIPPYTAPGGAQQHGLWSMNSLVPAFNFMQLELSCGGQCFRRHNGVWRNYRQVLDFGTATVTTSCEWQIEPGTLHVEYRIYLTRHQRELGVVELRVTAGFDGEITVTDRVDAGFIEELSQPRNYYRSQICPATAQVYSARVGVHNRLAAAATLLTVDFDGEHREELSCTPTGFERVCMFSLKRGGNLRITKFAAFAADNETPDPVNGALGVVAFAAVRPEKVRQRHEACWRELWDHDIETSHPGLQKLVRNALFQLYCNLGAGSSHIPGPVGLAGNHWGGHAFWDNEIWMFPVVALLNPALGRCFVDYRYRTLDGARRNAVRSGCRGTQWAWESAEFGDETIPDLIYAHQHHITSDIALAYYQYYLITGDDTFLAGRALPVITGAADFWLSRVTFNTAMGRYEIKAVCCVDEYAGIQDNNTSTNYSAVCTLRLAAALSEKLGLAANPEWRRVADRIWLPYDDAHGCHREYEHYDGGTIKQADTVLMIYPWRMPMDDDAKRRTVEYYGSKYPPGAIMMGSTIDGIIAGELGDAARLWKNLLSLLPHFRDPFGIVSESPLNEVCSFQTGLGGLLQLVVMGMGGLRLSEGGLTAHPPCLPEQVGYIRLHNICFGGRVFSLQIDHHGVSEIK